MDFPHPLRGQCQCGRNHYIIRLPKNFNDSARVLFNSNAHHRVAQASPLAAFLRVPLDWYQSATCAFFPDETSAMIRRVYTSPHEQHALRHFCGFCGTPLSYWSEQPRSEADFIQLAIGSLSSAGLGDLEDLGLLPGSDDEDPATPPSRLLTAGETAGSTATEGGTTGQESGRQELAVRPGRETIGGLPWFDSLVEGSRLGKIRHRRGGGQSHDGRIKYEWEVTEYTEDDSGSGDDTPRSSKRKFDEQENSNESMQGVER